MERINRKNYFKNYFVEQRTENEIIHFIMAENGTEAGDYYNDTVIEYIKCCVCISNELEKFNLVKELKKFFFISNQFISNEIKPEDIIDENNIIKITTKYKLKDFSSDFLDFTLGNTKFTPNYHPYITKDYKYYIIRIECPGGNSEIKNINVEFNENTIITIIGEKKLKLPQNENIYQIGGNKLSSGIFTIIHKISKYKKESNIDDNQDNIEFSRLEEGYIECKFQILNEDTYE